jgi:hypothetical protein
MTRWLLLVLMVLLPAQFSWAAAAPYCTHERSPTTFHVGHHVHVHTSAAPDARGAPSEPETGKSPPAPDHADCSVCHGVAGQVAAPVEPHFELPLRHDYLPAPPTSMGGGRAASIERPQWARVA